MSGPKVVRVVTRDEVIALCRGQLARLDAALAAWVHDGRRNDGLGEAEIAVAERRRNEIAALLTQDRFVELQKAVPQEIAFLRADQQERQTRLAAAAARARKAERREAEAAGALLRSLERSGKAVPEAVAAGLRAAAEGRSPAASALSAGFDLLSAPSAEDHGRLTALAASLKENDRSRTLEAWLEAQPTAQDELPLARIEARLCELSALAGDEAAHPYEARLLVLRAGAGEGRRSLLLDSLALDLGKVLAEARHVAALRARLDETLAELAAVDPTAAAVLRTEAKGESAAALEALAVRAAETSAAAREAQAAEARRRTVLQGLADLGYEVGEGLATAWVKDGRIVLRRPAQPGYGVELAGKADRLQMRVVAFGEGAADPARDRDAESLWCGDVTALQERLAAAGGGLIIEKALAVGAVPVKRLVEVEDRSAAREGRAPKTRTLG